MVDANGNFNWLDKLLGRDHKPKDSTMMISKNNLDSCQREITKVGNTIMHIEGKKPAEIKKISEQMQTKWREILEGTHSDAFGGLVARMKEVIAIHDTLTIMTDVLSSNKPSDFAEFEKEVKTLLDKNLPICKNIGKELYPFKTPHFTSTESDMQFALEHYMIAVSNAAEYFDELKKFKEQLATAA